MKRPHRLTKPKDTRLAALFEQIMKDDGNVLCEKCSTPNWKLYHAPGNPCPIKDEPTMNLGASSK